MFVIGLSKNVRMLSFLKPSADDFRSHEIIEFQTEINEFGNAATNDNLLLLRSFSDAIDSIDLEEIAIGTTGETALDSSLPTLLLPNPDHSNSSGTQSRHLVLGSATAGYYFREYNTKVNLYRFNGAQHRPGSQVFRVLILKPDGTRMNTTFVRMRLCVSYKKMLEMQQTDKFNYTILNAPT